MPVGHTLYVIGSLAEANRSDVVFTDYLARLTLSQSGKAWGEGISVRPEESALLEALANGSVHPALVEEPRAVA